MPGPLTWGACAGFVYITQSVVPGVRGAKEREKNLKAKDEKARMAGLGRALSQSRIRKGLNQWWHR